MRGLGRAASPGIGPEGPDRGAVAERRPKGREMMPSGGRFRADRVKNGVGSGIPPQDRQGGLAPRRRRNMLLKPRWRPAKVGRSAGRCRQSGPDPANYGSRTITRRTGRVLMQTEAMYCLNCRQQKEKQDKKPNRREFVGTAEHQRGTLWAPGGRIQWMLELLAEQRPLTQDIREIFFVLRGGRRPRGGEGDMNYRLFL